MIAGRVMIFDDLAKAGVTIETTECIRNTGNTLARIVKEEEACKPAKSGLSWILTGHEQL